MNYIVPVDFSGSVKLHSKPDVKMSWALKEKIRLVMLSVSKIALAVMDTQS